jgi:hypothetical protein
MLLNTKKGSKRLKINNTIKSKQMKILYYALIFTEATIEDIINDHTFQRY